MDWLKEPPWWIKWASTGGFGLVSTFASEVLPARWQALGFYGGLGLIGFASAGWIWHKLRVAHNNRVLRPMSVITIGLIIIGIGFIITLGGVYFFNANPSFASPTVQNTQPAPQPVNNSALIQAMQRTRSPVQKHKLDEALGELSDLLNRTGRDLSARIDELQQRWEPSTDAGKQGNKRAVTELQSRLNEIQAQTATLCEGISGDNGILQTYLSYDDDLNVILNPSDERQSYSAAGICNNLKSVETKLIEALAQASATSSQSDAAAILELATESRYKQFRDLIGLYKRWLQGVMANIDQFRPALQYSGVTFRVDPPGEKMLELKMSAQTGGKIILPNSRFEGCAPVAQASTEGIVDMSGIHVKPSRTD